jgi:hypothetical protein
LNDGSKPEDIPVEDQISVMLDESSGFTRSTWSTPQLKDVILKDFESVPVEAKWALIFVA